MYTIDEIRVLKDKNHYTNEQLSRLSGVPLGTVQKVMGKATKSPRMDTIRALSAVFEKHSSVNDPDSTDSGSDESFEGSLRHDGAFVYNVSMINVPENVHNYPRQGHYTLDDYLSLPDDQRVELIDGVIYDMGIRTVPHQLICGYIYTQLHNYIAQNGKKCIPFISQTDVQLDCDNRTIVQPDVMIVFDRSKITRKRIFGAPDLAIEVLSPSTRRKDMLIKSAKYQAAGVREYWIVDPDQENIITYDFRDEINIKMYTFDDKVPLGIFFDKCIIDFNEMRKCYSFLDESEEI